MSIATKLTYLNETKGKIKDSINLTGANIGSNDTFRSYAVKLRDGLVNVLNNGTIVLYNNFPKVSGTGSSISLSNTLEAPMFMNKFDGDTLQNGTPTPDTPVEIQSVEGIQNVNVCGKNFVNYNNFIASTGTTINNITNNDITATFVGTYKAASLYYNLENKKYVFSVGNISNPSARIELYLYKNGEQIIKQNVSGNNSYSFDNTNGIYDRTRLALSNANLSGTNQITFSNIQLELGTTPTTYETYTGDTYEVNLEGKNLLPFTNQDFTLKNVRYYVQNGNLYLDGTNTGETTSINQLFKDNFSFYLDVGTYTLQDKGLVSGNRDIRKYSDGTVLARLSPNNKVLSFTLTERTQVYLGFYIYNQTYNNELIELQLEKGSTATSYVPYRSPIKLYNGDKIVGTPDNWSIVRNNGSVVLNGSENIENWTSGTNTIGFKLTNVSNLKNIESSSTENIIISNYFTKSASQNALTSNDVEGFATTGGNLYFKINKTTANSLASFKTWLSTHNTIVDYVLATPTTTPITDTTLISQLNNLYNAKSYDNQTNITVDGQLPMILEVSAIKDEI